VRGRRRLTGFLPVAWFGLLALLIAGPLLGGGWLLLLDYLSGPRAPGIEVFPLPSSGDIGNALPLLALHAALGEVYSTLPDKLYLLAPVLIGGSGAYRLARRRLGVSALAGAYGGTLFVVNPFTYDRYLAGQLFFLLGYSLLPWALGPLFDLLRRPSARATVRAGFWVFALGAVSVHVAGIYLLLLVATALVASSRRGLAYGATALALGTLASSYWLLPGVFTRPGPDVGPADLRVYESRPRGFAVLPTLMGMDGFWRDEFAAGPERHPSLYLLLVPILGLAVLGAVQLFLRADVRRFAIVLSVAGVVGLFLASGSSFPATAEVFRWLYGHVPFFGAYREPQKFLALVLLGYAVFGAMGLETILRGVSPRLRTAVLPTAAMAATVGVLGYGYTLFWGFAGQVELARYPPGWLKADRKMAARGDGRLLVFPWHLYAVWSFSGSRIVANPTRSFFSRDVLTANEPGFTRVAKQSPDPFTYYVEDVLQHRAGMHWLGHLIAPLGVRFVAVLKEADWPNYAFVQRQEDLTPVFEDTRLTIFENRAWHGEVMGLARGSPGGSLSNVFGTQRERDATSRLITRPPDLRRAPDGSPPLARPLPDWRHVRPVAEAFVATSERCTDGWKLGDQESTCHLGAVAAFARPNGEEVLWRPLVGANLAGYILSGLTLLGAGMVLWRGSRPGSSSA
jgi:hypothetical protein